MEIDVRLTADGSLILSHDDRTAGHDPFIENDLVEIRREQEHVATLNEGWAAVPDDGYVNIEIKNALGEADYDVRRRSVDLVAEWIGANADGRRIVISSFDPWAMRKTRRILPGVATGQLLATWAGPKRVMPWVAGQGHDAINLPRRQLFPEPEAIVRRADELGLRVVAWTIDDPEDARQLSAAGVAALITNDPQGVLAALA